MQKRITIKIQRKDKKWQNLNNAPVAQLVEQEPLHGEGPNMLAGKTKPLVRIQPGAPN